MSRNDFEKQAKQIMSNILDELRKFFNYTSDEYIILKNLDNPTVTDDNNGLYFLFHVTFFQPRKTMLDAQIVREVPMEIRPDLSINRHTKTFKYQDELQQLLRHVKIWHETRLASRLNQQEP